VTVVRRGNPNYRWNLALALQMQKRCVEALAEWRQHLVVSDDPEGRRRVAEHIKAVFLDNNGTCSVVDGPPHDTDFQIE
jgi:hypothetical protein